MNNRTELPNRIIQPFYTI